MEDESKNNLNDPERLTAIHDNQTTNQNFQPKPCHLAIALAGLTVFLSFFGSSFFGRHTESVAMYFFWPLYWFAQHFYPRGGGAWWILFVITVFFIYAYLVWWLLIFGLIKSSKHFRWTLVMCALCAVGLFLSLKSYRSQVDWTSRGLNPNRLGYKPSVVLLAGTVDYRFTDSETHWVRAGTARFEIRMCGYDRYYEMLWTGNSRTYNTFAFTRIALTNFYGTWNRSFAGSGHHGRGGSSEGAYTGLLPGRRLWNGNEFVGVTDELTVTNKNQSEIFAKFQQFGSYKIPGEIEFIEGDHHELFVVRRVEFLPQPNEEWFDLVREKYFGNDQKLRGMDLGEPVW